MITKLTCSFDPLLSKIPIDNTISIYSITDCNFEFGKAFLIDAEINDGKRTLYYIKDVEFNIIVDDEKTKHYPEDNFLLILDNAQETSKEITKLFPDAAPLLPGNYKITVPSCIYEFFAKNINYMNTNTFVSSPIFFIRDETVFVKNEVNSFTNFHFLITTVPEGGFFYNLEDANIFINWITPFDITKVNIPQNGAKNNTILTDLKDSKFVLLEREDLNSTIDNWNNLIYTQIDYDSIPTDFLKMIFGI